MTAPWSMVGHGAIDWILLFKEDSSNEDTCKNDNTGTSSAGSSIQALPFGSMGASDSALALAA